MAVQDIKYYRQQNGKDIFKVTFKPTKNFPDGVTYVDACFKALIREYKYLEGRY